MDGVPAESCTIGEESALRGLFGQPGRLAAQKTLHALDRHCRDFIARSPFLCLGTADAAGRADVSPRGDRPGFVLVLDDRTLAIPDRPGNNRIDSMSNIVANPNVGLLFLIPGFEDTLRVNGKAEIVRDPDLLDRTAVDGKRPKVAIRVAVEECFLHCAKALKRSRLWEPESRAERSVMPTLGQMILDQTAGAGAAPAETEVREADRLIDENYRTQLY
ncbi:MAG: pyridoxamine 5'-phosphate oxidase family protein [Dongiaceae bacterium]